MTAYHSSKIETFLRAVDRHLVAPMEIRVIGGAAAVLSFGLQTATSDIDLKSIAVTTGDVVTICDHLDSDQHRRCGRKLRPHGFRLW